MHKSEYNSQKYKNAVWAVLFIQSAVLPVYFPNHHIKINFSFAPLIKTKSVETC